MKGRGELERKIYCWCKTPQSNCQNIIEDTEKGGRETTKKRPRGKQSWQWRHHFVCVWGGH